jgi:hypothetical protein
VYLQDFQSQQYFITLSTHYLSSAAMAVYF